MDLSIYNPAFPTLGLITAILTAWYTGQKVVREYRKFRKASTDKILDEAKEYSHSVKDKLEAKITLLEVELNNLKSSVASDILHIKEVQANEIRGLSDKIENLREELRNGHSSLIALLTQLVNKN